MSASSTKASTPRKKPSKTFGQQRFNTVIPCLPADEILKRLLKTLSQQRSETVITRLPTDENSITVENKKRLLKTLGPPRFDTVMPADGNNNTVKS